MLTLQRLIAELCAFWESEGCLIEQPYDNPVGAGTMHPATFLRVLGPEPWRCAYVQPSLQVVLKPSPDDVQQMYLRSLERLGIAAADHDIRFEEDNWESPTLGAWGVGWQVVMDGMEITQFTYFQQAGGIDLAPISAEITYGLERIAMFLNKVHSIYDVPWTESLTYGQVRRTEEEELSRYYFEVADVELASLLLDRWEAEARRALAAGLAPVQRSRCARRRLGDRPRGSDPPRSRSRVRVRPGLRRDPRRRVAPRHGTRAGGGPLILGFSGGAAPPPS